MEKPLRSSHSLSKHSMHSVRFAETRKIGLIVYKTEEEVRRALFEMVVFACFLLVTTIIAVSCHSTYDYYFNQTIERLFLKREVRGVQKSKPFAEVTIINDWWDFIKYSFTDDILMDLATTSKALKVERRFLDINVILEPPRLRQIRMKPQKCYDHKLIRRSFNECYSSYDEKNEQDEPMYKGTKYYPLGNSHLLPIWATIETYRGGGYVKYLSYDYEESHTIIDDLIKSHWIDRSTRLAIAELVIYNNNLDIFSNIKFMIEVLPTGGVVPHWSMKVVPYFSPWSTTRPFLLTALIIFYIIIISNALTEIWEIYNSGLKSYATQVWNYVDCTIIITSIITAVLSVMYGFHVDHYINIINTETTELCSLDTICYVYATYKATIAVCTFLAWIRIFRFISFNETMFYFTMTLKKCAPEIFGFAIILFIFFISFALLGLLLFGFTHPDFSSFRNAYVFMLRLLLRDFEYSNFEDADPFWGALYFMCYILIVIFILMNMFLAIISQTYIQVKKNKQESTSLIKVVFLDFLHNVLRLGRRFRARLNMKSYSFLHRSPSRMPTGTTRPLSEETITPKKLTFETPQHDDEDEGKYISTSNLKSDRSSKSLTRDEALKVYFGDEPLKDDQPKTSTSVSDISLSSYKSIESMSEIELMDEPEEEPPDVTEGMHERLDALERAFEELKNDLERLNSILGH